MINTLYLPELREMLAASDMAELREFCTALHAGRTAEFMEGLTAEEAWAVLQAADRNTRAEIFVYLPEEMQIEILETSDPKELSQLIADMAPGRPRRSDQEGRSCGCRRSLGSCPDQRAARYSCDCEPIRKVLPAL